MKLFIQVKMFMFLRNHPSYIYNYLLNKNIATKSELDKIYGNLYGYNYNNHELQKLISINVIKYCTKTKDKTIALNCGIQKLDEYGVLQLGILIQKNYLLAFDYILKNLRYTTPFANINMFFTNYVYFTFEPLYFTIENDEEYIFSIEYHMSQIYHLLNDFLPFNLTIKEINLCYSQTFTNKYFENFFKCKVNYNATNNSIVFNITKKLLTTKLPPLPYEFISKKINKLIENSNPINYNITNLKDKILDILNHNDYIPDENSIANLLNIHPRTLRRKLKNEGETYRELVLDFKKKKAINLLLCSNSSLKQVAYNLGFKNSSSFSKAFKKWTGYSPQQYILQKTKK